MFIEEYRGLETDEVAVSGWVIPQPEAFSHKGAETELGRITIHTVKHAGSEWNVMSNVTR